MSDFTRVIKADKNAKAGIKITENSITLVGDDRHLIVVNEQGITIKGPTSMINDSMGRREGGLFVGLNDFLEMIPSTIVTPIPKKIPFPPIHGLINLQKDVAFFMALLV